LSTTDDSSVVVDLAPRTARVIIEGRSIRTGKWPLIPKPRDIQAPNGNKYLLLDQKFTPHTPMLGSDSRKTRGKYTIEWRLEYAVTRPTDAMDAGQSPALVSNLLQRTVSATVLSPHIFYPQT